MFSPGDKLEYGHYTVLRELGAGGMGVVYHCRDEFLQREIAIKMLLPELMADNDTVEVFRQEARLAAALEHPNVVTIHNIGLENREGKVHHYIAMEFLPGGSLKQRIVQKENLSMEQNVEWMKQLAIGLNYAHKRGVVHQDIKPDNIFITQDGNLKIGDFGLALIATGVAIERAVQGKGTPAYMSPELCRGDPQDHRSDIYSLGAVFYELLTYEKPYKASGMIEMAMKHATAPIPAVKKMRPDVPDVLDKAIQKMMAKSADDRFQSLAEVLTILEKLLLEIQVARLGVGTSKPISETANLAPAPPAPPQVEKIPQNLIPNAASYQDEFAAFLAEQGSPSLPGAKTDKKTDGKAKATPAPAEAPSSSVSDPLDGVSDPLDDLLDTLLAEQPADLFDAPAAVPPTNKADVADAAKQELLKEETLDLGAKAAEPTEQDFDATSGTLPALDALRADGRPMFNDDVTGEIDAIYQSVVRAEAAAMAQASRAAAEAGEIGIPIPGPAADGAARVSRTNMKPVSERKLDMQWSFHTSGPIGWSSQPVLSKDRKLVYVASSDGKVYALDAAKGSVSWHHDAGAAILASPVVTGDKLLVASSNGSLHALATTTGAKLWEYGSSAPLVSTPKVHNNFILLGSMDGSVKCLNLSDGTVKWTYRTDGPVVCTPEVLENLVFISSRDKSLHAVSLEKGWRQWVYATQGALTCSPLVSTDSVYVGSTDGAMYSVEAETGKLVWKYATEKPIICRGTLEFTAVTVSSEDKWVHCIEKYKGGLVWKAKLHSLSMANMSSTGGHLYVANREGWVQCFNVKDGSIVWQMNCEKRLESTPVVSGKTLYLGMVSGDLCAYTLP